MLNRKGAVSMAIVAAVTASAGSALAETQSTTLTLEPTVATMQAAAAPARKPLMNGLDRLGAAKTLDDYGINIYGWVEASYTYNHRHINKISSVTEGSNKVGVADSAPFNHQAGDNIMGNQLAIRFERSIVSTEKVDVGGLVEVMYGQDAAAIHANGLEYGMSGSDDRFHPNYQFDIPQAYIDIAVGVKGLTIRAGKFYTLLGYESVKPDDNALFSHSYLFYNVPFTHMGILASYQVNDQWKVTAGVTRGWDQAFEDNNDCAIDVLYKIEYNPNTQWTIALAGSVGPENADDTAHYRVTLDPTVIYRVTEQLTLGAEVLYTYDGGYQGHNPGAYGDVWGAAIYAGYKINDMFTVNGRAEKFHGYTDGSSATNIYAFTLGVTITPFPNDPFGSGLKLRPEVRYDYSEDAIFTGSSTGGTHRDTFTIGMDLIYAF